MQAKARENAMGQVAAFRIPAERPDRSLDASDDFEMPRAPDRYCPTTQLAKFTLLMAGHGRCVSADMMLGDREYAVWQLARAHTLDDADLREVAVSLFGYFAEPRVSNVVPLHA
jgi:hypothetical protein